MLVEPAIAAFAATYQSGQPQIVYSKLIADLEVSISIRTNDALGNVLLTISSIFCVPVPSMSIFELLQTLQLGDTISK